MFAKFFREIAGVEIDINTDSENEVFQLVQLGFEFGQNPGDFPSANHDIVGPFDLGR